MVGSCIAPGCSNYYSPRRHVSYFRFPNPSKYPELHKAWLRAMSISGFKPSKHSCICELHFSEEDFDETYKMKKVLMPSDYFRPVLKQGAVPKLEVQGGGSKRKEEQGEILRQLLGDSYLKWKKTANVVKIEKIDEEEKEVRKGFDKVADSEKNKGHCVFVKKEKIEIEEEECKKMKFDITRDFVLKQPLKPLPAELQRIIPTILSVVIKEAPNDRESEKNLKIETKQQQFSCKRPLCVKHFHCCQMCDFTTFLRINLLNHARTAHCPIRTHQIERLPMKIYKHKEPKKYTCNNCDFSTYSRLILLKHAHKTKEYHLLGQIEVRWFKCEFCAYKSRTSGGLKKHLTVKHEPRPYPPKKKLKYEKKIRFRCRSRYDCDILGRNFHTPTVLLNKKSEFQTGGSS